ncbi:MAG: PrsW family intramembrane metalloprotease [Chloroflexi bacterium]|nr:PrsW family intramembrane metalloprotease [Chloroflexota bacterium]
MVEDPVPPIDPGGPTTSGEPIAPEPARWSTRARRRLMAALIIGAITAAIGALLFFQPNRVLDVEGVLMMYLGLILMPIGAGLAFMAARTLPAAPDHLYQPHWPQVPRNLFVIFWLVGVITPLVLHVESVGDLKTFSLVALGVASAFVLSGGRWAFRWFANKLHDEWPTGRIDAPPAVPLYWPRNWTIGWAGMFGVLASVLAAAVELLIIWVVANLLGPLLAESLPASLDASDILSEVLSQPLVLIGVFVAVAIVAPTIEEAAKALGLRVLRSSIQRPIDGLMLGMSIGISFGIMESGLYLSSLSGWLIGGWLRLSTLILHGIATSLVGVAYARSLISGKRRDVWAGYGRAVLLHGVWNASAIGIAVGFGNAASWWLGILCLIVLIFLIARMIPRTVMAGAQTAIQEGHQQAAANLPAEWSPSDYGVGWRLMGSRPRRGVRVVPEATQPITDEIDSSTSAPPAERPADR